MNVIDVLYNSHTSDTFAKYAIELLTHSDIKWVPLENETMPEYYLLKELIYIDKHSILKSLHSIKSDTFQYLYPDFEMCSSLKTSLYIYNTTYDIDGIPCNKVRSVSFEMVSKYILNENVVISDMLDSIVKRIWRRSDIKMIEHLQHVIYMLQ
jgi:hypothetical protein